MDLSSDNLVTNRLIGPGVKNDISNYRSYCLIFLVYILAGVTNGSMIQADMCTKPGIEQLYPKRDLYPFQPVEEIDFSTVDGITPRIPHILHQIFNVEYIPTIYRPFIESFIHYNPYWQYRFWTYSSSRQLLQCRFPHLVETFDGFGNEVEKADMIRYLVLYEYGGVYADLDMEFYKSLDRLTMKYAVIFPLEPVEHSWLNYNASYFLAICILMSRPKHPFFKLILDGLEGAKPIQQPHVTTGPIYITNKFQYYNNIIKNNENDIKVDFSSNLPYFYKGHRREEDNNAVYVPNAQYLMNNVKDNVLERLEDVCNTSMEEFSKLPYFKHRACIEFLRRQEVKKNKKFTYTEHHWSCLWRKSQEFIINLGRIYIGDIITNCTFYN